MKKGGDIEMRSKDLLFWIWLSEVLGPASRDFKTLYSLNDSPYEFFRMEESEIEPLLGISPKAKQALCKKDLRRATEILEICERSGYEILVYSDKRYPTLLREIDRPPVLLYYVGRLPDMDSTLALGMVGTRRMSAYGLKTAYKISYELASVGAIIVSGMAAGIDGVAATAALDAGKPTVAILGCGLDQVYPKHHAPLMREIREKGAILSEYAPGTRPNFYNFPVRNRIISGLSHGTVVVEAGNGSGSLITANEAVRQGRDVFAVPANVGAVGAEGTNGLLRDGAKLVLETKDILRCYQMLLTETLIPERLAKAEKQSSPDLARLQALGVIALNSVASIPSEEKTKSSKNAPKKTDGASDKRTARNTQRRREATEEVSPSSESLAKSASETAHSSKPTPDAVLQSLSSLQRALLEAIPEDRAVTTDALCNLGYPQGECLAALTMLEIMGLVSKLPGSLYKKA